MMTTLLFTMFSTIRISWSVWIGHVFTDQWFSLQVGQLLDKVDRQEALMQNATR